MASTTEHSVAETHENNEDISLRKEYLEMFKNALTSVLTDQGFSISERGTRARLCSQRLLEWISSNKDLTMDYCQTLITDLNRCLKHPRKVKCRTLRERMWEKYFKFRSSDNFKRNWDTFLQKAVGFNACPIFYQYVTDKLMERVITDHFSLDSEAVSGETDIFLDYEESNAIRYTAGYVIRSLLKKLPRSRHPDKDEMVLCLQELMEDVKIDESEHRSSDWIKIIDRGGLVRVNDELYMVFVEMELNFRHKFNITTTEKLKESFAEELVANEDVLFYWALVSVNWDESTSTKLLKEIANHWVTVRGYSSASSFIKLYKKASKSSLQKSKGLRKNLYSGNTQSEQD